MRFTSHSVPDALPATIEGLLQAYRQQSLCPEDVLAALWARWQTTPLEQDPAWITRADADFLHRHPWLKAQLAKLPRALWPKAVPYGLVVALNEQGEIIQSLHDSSGTHLRMITSAKPVGDYLYLGSLNNDRIGKLRIR